MGMLNIAQALEPDRAECTDTAHAQLGMRSRMLCGSGTATGSAGLCGSNMRMAKQHAAWGAATLPPSTLTPLCHVAIRECATWQCESLLTHHAAPDAHRGPLLLCP